MKNSINNLKNQFTGTEVLSAEQCCTVKGGGGEDLRKSLVASRAYTTAVFATSKVATSVAAPQALKG
jgi:hypothetical protein